MQTPEISGLPQPDRELIDGKIVASHAKIMGALTNGGLFQWNDGKLAPTERFLDARTSIRDAYRGGQSDTIVDAQRLLPWPLNQRVADVSGSPTGTTFTWWDHENFDFPTEPQDYYTNVRFDSGRGSFAENPSYQRTTYKVRRHEGAATDREQLNNELGSFSKPEMVRYSDGTMTRKIVPESGVDEDFSDTKKVSADLWDKLGEQKFLDSVAGSLSQWAQEQNGNVA